MNRQTQLKLIRSSSSTSNSNKDYRSPHEALTKKRSYRSLIYETGAKELSHKLVRQSISSESTDSQSARPNAPEIRDLQTAGINPPVHIIAESPLNIQPNQFNTPIAMPLTNVQSQFHSNASSNSLSNLVDSHRKVRLASCPLRIA